jgi:zinc/manganese transport system substrate-binding protein
MPRLPRRRIIVAPLLGFALAGCGVSVASNGGSLSGSGATPASVHGHFVVVAAENFWGSIAVQLAGTRATVRSIIVNPNTDPHSYDPTPANARTLAGADLAIVNGIGYDVWVPRLLAASPRPGRIVLSVGTLLGLVAGDNPHQWYSPSHVMRVVKAILADYVRLDPGDARYFRAREAHFETRDLATYRRLIAEIRARYRGVPVGYSESIFQPLGEALGLRLLTPYGFAKAIAEGSDPTAAETEAVDRQAQDRLIRVWVFNSQNVTPDVERVNSLARAAGIPIATVTETLSPASDSFEQWQVAELERLQRALHRATGR